MKKIFKLLPFILTMGLLASCGETPEPGPGPDPEDPLSAETKTVKYDFTDMSKYGYTAGGAEISHVNNSENFTNKVKENVEGGENVIDSAAYESVFTQKVGVSNESYALHNEVFLCIGTRSAAGSVIFRTTSDIVSATVEYTAYQKSYASGGQIEKTVDEPEGKVSLSSTDELDQWSYLTFTEAPAVGYNTESVSMTANASGKNRLAISVTTARVFLLSVTLTVSIAS